MDTILATYASFFDWAMWAEVLTSPTAWGLIISLALIEGILGADNAIVLALMVKHLPEKQRKRALQYGMIGAYLFRFIFIGLGTLLVKLWWVKALGAAYLAYITISHFAKKGGDDHGKGVPQWLTAIFGPFVATIIMVEIMDIAFSADSILAALAISEEVWVLLLGGMLGILMMRTVAGFFLYLIEKFPTLEDAAFVLIGIIALKMAASIFHFHVSHVVFFIVLVVVFGGTMIYDTMKAKKATNTAA